MSKRSILALTAAGALIAAGCGNQDVVTSSDNVVDGKKTFVQKCGSCHTLSRANTKGTVGPNLDAAFKQALIDGQKRSTVRGIVYDQILHPAQLKAHSTGTQMPPKLVEGQDAHDVAAYVASVAAKPGKDTGLLATAVQAAGGGEAAVEKGGVLQIDADPSGQLAFVTKKATGTAGPVTLKMKNTSGAPHDLSIEGNGVNAKTPVTQNGTVQTKTTLATGTYTFFCSVPGHREAGMQGKLVVK
jgi:mono/diheme cytochrome c family protein